MAFKKKDMAGSLQYPHLAKLQQAAKAHGMSYKKIGKLSGAHEVRAISPVRPSFEDVKSLRTSGF